MSDTQGKIDEAAQTTQDAADQVTEQVTEQAADTPESVADTVSEKVGDVVDAAKSAASDVKAAAGKVADAATDAATSAGARIKDAADDVDLDQLVSQTRTVAGEWTEKLKQTYRERPGVVISAAVGAVVVATAVVRAIARR